MQTQTKSTTTLNRRQHQYAKCVCISFPAHELDLIDELDRLAETEGLSRSQYIRRAIRKEKESK